MTGPGAASEHNKLFPEKGQRVQRHKGRYSVAGCAWAWARNKGRADTEATKHCTSQGCQCSPVPAVLPHISTKNEASCRLGAQHHALLHAQRMEGWCQPEEPA